MPPLVVLTVIWVAHPVGIAVVRPPEWGSAYDAGFYLPGALGLLAAWTTCRRRPAGRWWATALAFVSMGISAWMWTRNGTIGPGVVLWTIAMPALVLYTVHLRHRAWFDGGPKASDQLPAIFD